MRFSKFMQLMILPLFSANLLLCNIWFFFSFYSESKFVSNGFFQGLLEYFGATAYFMMFGIFASYIVVIIIGFPFYFFAQKYYKIDFVGVILAAMFLAVFPVIFFMNGFTFDQHLIGGKFYQIVSLALCGLIAGMVFWKQIQKEE